MLKQVQHDSALFVILNTSEGSSTKRCAMLDSSATPQNDRKEIMKKLTYSLLLTTGYFLLAPMAHAQICNPVLSPLIGCGGTAAGGTIVGSIISALTGLFLIGGTIATLLFLLLGGFRWITSSGDKQKLPTAQDQITNAIVGLIIMTAAWAIMMLVGQFTGIGIFGANGWNISLPSITGGASGSSRTGSQTVPVCTDPVTITPCIPIGADDAAPFVPPQPPFPGAGQIN